jgi:hypothetical protein
MLTHPYLTLFVALPLLLGGCERGADSLAPENPSDEKGGTAMTIEVTSSAFEHEERIPEKYTEDGADVSPPLSFSGVPAEAKELVLICDDPDAPTAEPWVHWLLYKIPASVESLAEGIPNKPRLKDPPGVLQGKNSWKIGTQIGYRGPAPPPGGPHRYFFQVYALNVKLVIEPGVTKSVLLQEIKDHVIAEGELMGVYER